MKSLHRTKAIAAYEGAREVLKKEMAYPTYVLLKEAVRGTLAYIVEDTENYDISEKTKLHKLIYLVRETIVSESDKEKLRLLVEAEREGLGAITSMEIEKLAEIKVITKKLIGTHLCYRS